jgi:hypothetical protein
MAEISRLGSAEGRLCGVLASAIARQVTASDRAVGAGRKGAAFFHYFESSLEFATEVLERLGLLAPAATEELQNGMPYRPNALTMDADAMPGFLGPTIAPGDARIDDTIACFVNIACYYGGLSDERAPFVPPQPFAEAMRWLARFGYAEALGSRYRWSDRIGPAMQACYLWDARLRSETTLERELGMAEAEAAWRSMPDAIRSRFFSKRPIAFVEFMHVLSRHWHGGRWHAAGRDGWLLTNRALAWRITEIADGRSPNAWRQ